MIQSSSEFELKLPPLWLGVLAFIFSGFAGLVYEATWTRYLKIILGADAFAQALVLTIFLGGLAIGAIIIGKYTKQIISPLIYYAFIEAVLALFAVYFHNIFEVVYAYLNLGNEHVIYTRWILCVVIILPQSILLGATFPLLTAAMIREQENNSGSRIAVLYFANSIGGFLGVIAVSFVLVEIFGLPGSMLVGASFSAIAGFLAWVVHHRYRLPKINYDVNSNINSNLERKDLTTVLLIVAFGTGLASFIYEIIWIRMLALVFGSSSRAFELMLAAFIFGLAFGGLFASYRAQQKTRLITLSFVQILMGTFVIVSIFAYELMFDLTVSLWQQIPQTDNGFLIYGLSNLGLAILYMFIPTFCAGMTLPLVTREVLESKGEKALSMVYAWNTIGAIIGIWLALHILLPNFGLKHGMTIGVAIDLSLGLLIIYYAYNLRFKYSILAVATLLVLVVIKAPYDNKTILQGLYLFGRNTIGEDSNIEFVKHGKVYTSSVVNHGIAKNISYNGKSEGSLPNEIALIDETQRPTDLQTTVLVGALPLLYHPDAKKVAIIGLGTGKSAATVLESEIVEEVTTIEIEAATIEAAKLFSLSQRIYVDERHEFINADAKTYFASNNSGPFDIIISVPSNPWISGVANLFTQEHYKVASNQLNDDGLLVQWFPSYDINENAVASIFKALKTEFPYYVFYTSLASDIIIIAAKDPLRLQNLTTENLSKLPNIKTQLAQIQIHNINDIASIYVGNNELFDPYIESLNTVVANSDYFPILENNAIKAWYKKERYFIARYLYNYGFLSNLSEYQVRQAMQQVNYSDINVKQKLVSKVLILLDENIPLSESFIEYAAVENFDLTQIRSIFAEYCNVSEQELFNRASYLINILSAVDLIMYPSEKEFLHERVVNEIPCFREMLDNATSSVLLNFYQAYLLNDHKLVVNYGNQLFANYNTIINNTDIVLFLKYLLSEYQLGNYERVFLLSNKLGQNITAEEKFAIRLLLAHNLSKLSPENTTQS